MSEQAERLPFKRKPVLKSEEQLPARSKEPKLTWEQLQLLFEAIRDVPDMTAQELRTEASELGLNLSSSTAYRVLRKYKSSGGHAINLSRGHVKVVASILESAEEGTHLTPVEIELAARKFGTSLHISTIYRVLERLVAAGLVVHLEKDRKTLYEWKREGQQHGHLTCIICDKTIEFYQDYLEALSKRVCSTFDFEYCRYEFKLLAKCSSCRLVT